MSTSGLMQHQLGGISIQRIIDIPDGPFRLPTDFFPEATDDAVAEILHRFSPSPLCPKTGRLILPVQSYLIRSAHHTTLIDTCIGCDKTIPRYPAWNQRSDRRWLDNLAAAGVSPEDIDYVFCTHLHIDHAGWNTQLLDGRWVPTFPNAKYVFAREELAPAEAANSDCFRESVLPILEAGQALVVDADHALDDMIWLEPTFGHTAGHVAVNLASSGHHAVMCGDLMHSPLQLARPDWTTSVDTDPQMAARTRKLFLDKYTESGSAVLTAHFPSPSMGHLVRDGNAFNFRYF